MSLSDIVCLVIYETRYCDNSREDIIVDDVCTVELMYKNVSSRIGKLVLGYRHDVFGYAIKNHPGLLLNRNQIGLRHRLALGCAIGQGDA